MKQMVVPFPTELISCGIWGENRHSVARKPFIINEISSVWYLALMLLDSDPIITCLSCFVPTYGEREFLYRI
jgi:hypothetical protein